MSILEVFCSVDEFWQHFAPAWERELLASGTRRRQRNPKLQPSEIMTIVILFQQSHYRTLIALPDLQGVSHQLCPGPVAQRVPPVGQL
jgi:hypothetical protein